MRLLVAMMAAALCAGCASIARGTAEQLQFDSEPRGAIVRTVEDFRCGLDPCVEAPPPGPSCLTPCVMQVKRNAPILATFSKDGYQPETLRIDTKLAGSGAVGVAGNAILGGAVGALVDVGTGAALDHVPNPAFVTLTPLKPEPARPRR